VRLSARGLENGRARARPSAGGEAQAAKPKFKSREYAFYFKSIAEYLDIRAIFLAGILYWLRMLAIRICSSSLNFAPRERPRHSPFGTGPFAGAVARFWVRMQKDSGKDAQRAAFDFADRVSALLSEFPFAEPADAKAPTQAAPPDAGQRT
jgi:hypothetical protein